MSLLYTNTDYYNNNTQQGLDRTTVHGVVQQNFRCFSNPKKGKIFNKPKGENVYKHILKDYTKETVRKDYYYK